MLHSSAAFWGDSLERLSNRKCKYGERSDVYIIYWYIINTVSCRMNQNLQMRINPPRSSAIFRLVYHIHANVFV